jgi:hypothetical protein
MDSNLCLTCYHDNGSKKTNSLQPNLMQYMEQQRQKAAEREILCIKRVNYRLHYEFLVLE